MSAAVFVLASVVLSPLAGAAEPALPSSPSRACPTEMVNVANFCIDRWEISAVDKKTGAALSPYYPPHPRLLEHAYNYWQLERHRLGARAARRFRLPELPEVEKNGPFEAMAVSLPGVVPQAYLSYYMAKRACENAGKRLCTQQEWVRACKGRHQTKHPYGGRFERSKCNVYRYFHPAFILHGDSSVGHLDPRLNLIVERATDPLLRLTGSSPGCVSVWDGDAIYDMVGNLDEWVADEKGIFLGGFYARNTSEGCESSISSHSPLYYDYSTGARCCKAAATP